MKAKLTNRELDVMSILWRGGSGTVNEVRDALADDLAYTSVLWVLQTLEEKGYVRHEKEGRAYRYFPLMAAEQAGENALSRIVDKVFHGSASLLLTHLVNEQSVDDEELARMRAVLDARLKERDE